MTMRIPKLFFLFGLFLFFATLIEGAQTTTITQEVVRLYDQAYPVKGGAPAASTPPPAPKPATPAPAKKPTP